MSRHSPPDRLFVTMSEVLQGNVMSALMLSSLMSTLSTERQKSTFSVIGSMLLFKEMQVQDRGLEDTVAGPVAHQAPKHESELSRELVQLK